MTIFAGLLPVTALAIDRVETERDELLLGSLSSVTTGGSLYTLPTPPAVTFSLALETTSDVYILRSAPQVYWFDGETGSLDHTAANSTGWSAVIAGLTNGVDDTVLSYSDISGGGSWGDGRHESEWGLGEPDFAGTDISRVRLLVGDVQLEQVGSWVNVQVAVTWEFWGVPEPTAGLMLVLGTLSTGVVRRRR